MPQLTSVDHDAALARMATAWDRYQAGDGSRIDVEMATDQALAAGVSLAEIQVACFHETGSL